MNHFSQKEDLLILERDEFNSEFFNYNNEGNGNNFSAQKTDQFNCLNENNQMNFITKTTGNEEYQALQHRILELEARIHDLEFERQSVSAHNKTNSTVSNSIYSGMQANNIFQEIKVKINDFSPEWDFVEGGSKMMICFSPNFLIPTEDQNNKLTVIFGDVEARAFCIQPGVIKCYGKE